MTAVPDSLDRRFRAAAASSGLLDVAYDLFDSPFGTLLLAASLTLITLAFVLPVAARRARLAVAARRS